MNNLYVQVYALKSIYHDELSTLLDNASNGQYLKVVESNIGK